MIRIFTLTHHDKPLTIFPNIKKSVKQKSKWHI